MKKKDTASILKIILFSLCLQITKPFSSIQNCPLLHAKNALMLKININTAIYVKKDLIKTQSEKMLIFIFFPHIFHFVKV